MKSLVALLLTLCLLAQSGTTSSIPRGNQSPTWSVSNFQSLITFGDSYTDESRLGYFISHDGSAPLPGTLLPESFATAGGGRGWARYVVQYTGSTVNGQWDPQMTLYDYAVSGAVCSNQITPRFVSLFFDTFYTHTKAFCA